MIQNVLINGYKKLLREGGFVVIKDQKKRIVKITHIPVLDFCALQPLHCFSNDHTLNDVLHSGLIMAPYLDSKSRNKEL